MLYNIALYIFTFYHLSADVKAEFVYVTAYFPRRIY